MAKIIESNRVEKDREFFAALCRDLFAKLCADYDVVVMVRARGDVGDIKTIAVTDNDLPALHAFITQARDKFCKSVSN